MEFSIMGKPPLVMGRKKKISTRGFQHVISKTLQNDEVAQFTKCIWILWKPSFSVLTFDVVYPKFYTSDST